MPGAVGADKEVRSSQLPNSAKATFTKVQKEVEPKGRWLTKPTTLSYSTDLIAMTHMRHVVYFLRKRNSLAEMWLHLVMRPTAYKVGKTLVIPPLSYLPVFVILPCTQPV